VRCRIGNTSEVPYSVDVGFGGSRSTNINSTAGVQAAAELRGKLRVCEKIVFQSSPNARWYEIVFP
jgi:hypothetical protein